MFLLLLILAGSKLAGASDLEYISCGSFICIDESGVACNSEGDGCDCSTGQANVGRIQCVNPDQMCLCTLFHDPHLRDFADQWTSLPLPCAHTLAELTYKSEVGDCHLQVRGLARYLDPNSASFASLETHVDLQLLIANTRLDIRFRGTQEPDIELYNMTGDSGSLVSPDNYMDYGVIVEDDGNYSQAIVPRCRFAIRHRGQEAVLAIVSPVGVADNKGVCGQCNGATPTATPLYQPDIFVRMLDSLNPHSPIDGMDMNIYTACRALTNNVEFCPSDRRDLADGYCGEMLTNPFVSPYFLNGNHTIEQLLTKLANCIGIVCENMETCTVVGSIYAGGFADGHVAEYVAIPGFCNESQ